MTRFLPMICLAVLSAVSVDMAGQSSPATTSWVFDGPQPLALNAGATPYSGRATSIAIDPTNWRTAYLGTTGSVWKTTNAGMTWHPVTDRSYPVIGAIAVAPSNPSIIYAATGENSLAVDSYSGQGVLKSTDAGATWTLQPGFGTFVGDGEHFYSIAVDPGNSNLVLGATADGVWRTADGGASWSQVLRHPSTAILFDKNNANIVYAGINGIYTQGIYESAVYKSMDKGQSWTAMKGLPGHRLPSSSTVIRTSLAQDSSGQTLYAGLGKSDYSAPGFLYKTTDGGTNWTKLTSPQDPGALDWYSNALAVIPGSNVLYAAGFHLSQSQDGGQTWHIITDPTLFGHQKNFAVTPDGGAMYAANEGGAFLTQNPSAPQSNFASLNATIGSMTFSKGFSILNDHKTLFASTYGHGIEIGPHSGSYLWTYADNYAVCFEGGSVFVDSHQHYAYAHCADGQASWISNPMGLLSPTTWQSAEKGINQSEPTGFVVDIQGDPNNESTVYTATNRVYQSTNHAGNWTPISPALTAHSYAVVTSVAVAPTDSNVVYAVSDDGVISVTDNALAGSGSIWTLHPYFAGGTYHGGYGLSKVVVSPTNSQEIYVSLQTPGSPGAIWKSTDGANSFQELGPSTVVPIPVNSIALDPDLLNIIYEATELGVYSTQNTNGYATSLSNNLPFSPVEDIKVDEATRTLFIVTHGRGAWHLPLGPAQGITLFPNGNSFGGVKVGTTSERDISVVNNYRARTLKVSTVSVSTGFTQTNNCTAVLTAGQSCTIQLTFAPTSVSNYSGQLTVNTDQGTVSPPVSGQGTI